MVHNSKHNSRYRYVLLVVVLSICLFGAWQMARAYYFSNTNRLVSVENAVLSQLERHDFARVQIHEIELRVEELKREGIDVALLEEQLHELKSTFAQGKYESIGSGSAALASSSAYIKERDEIFLSSYSAQLVNLQIKYQDYEKQGVKVATLSSEMASASAYLDQKQYAVVQSLVASLQKKLDTLLTIKKEEDKKVAAARAAVNNVAPIAAQSSGGVTYERKVVNTSIGGFTSDILTVDLSRVKVKTFTANENDCSADCPVKPLSSYVSENGGIAGINGTYFCPPDYSQCAGVKNSFNTLVFDYKSKHYLNSAQNQYSVNPLISFYPDGAHFYTQALGFGRDTSALGVISNHPTLMHNGGVATNPNLDAKSSSRGMRCGMGFRDKTLWAACVRGATVAESAYVYQALGAVYALNLDGGGSAALYFNGYRVGPGRLLPNAVVFTN